MYDFIYKKHIIIYLYIYKKKHKKKNKTSSLTSAGSFGIFPIIYFPIIPF